MELPTQMVPAEGSENSKLKEKVVSKPTSPANPLETLKQKVSSTPGPWSKSFLDQAKHLQKSSLLEDPHKRRSKRVLNQKQGYKNPQCMDKNCLGCTLVPPNLSPSVIRNLGESFYKVDGKELIDAALTKKKKAFAPVGKKLIKKKANPDDNYAADSKKDKKKPKK